MIILKTENTDHTDAIFIRLATAAEKNSETKKKQAAQSFPEKPGYDVAYKPYGEHGKGFYYVPSRGPR